jgi:site-specific recombinase XerC
MSAELRIIQGGRCRATLEGMPDHSEHDPVELFLDHLWAVGRAPQTIRLRRSQLHIITAELDLLTMRARDIEAFLARRRDLAAETRHSYQGTLRAWCRWAIREGLISTDPCDGMESIHVPRGYAHPCPDIRFLTALTSASLRDRAMLQLGRYACLRLTEISALHTRDRLGDRLDILGKGAKHRVVPINRDLATTLDAVEAEQGPGWYFPGRQTGHLHPQSVNKIITRCLGMNPHSLRHAGATAAYHATRDIHAVSEFLGHSSIATTQRYLALDLDDLQAVADATLIAA